jgi:DNA-binding beta-propeller fold protein YncE
VFVTGSDGVSALDAQSGALLWTALVGTSPTPAAVDARSGAVFVPGGVGGRLSVLDGRTGALLRTVAVGTSTGAVAARLGLSAVAVDERHGRVLVLEGDEARVAVLDVRGALLRRVAVGVQPLAVAIDAGMDRAFVLNYGGLAPPSTAWWDRAVAGLGHWLPWLAQRTPARASVPASVSVLDLGRI